MAAKTPAQQAGHGLMLTDAELRAVEALQAEAAPGDDPGLTSEEWAEALGRNVKLVRSRVIKPGLRGGVITRGYRALEGIDGRLYRTPVYRIISERPKGKSHG